MIFSLKKLFLIKFNDFLIKMIVKNLKKMTIFMYFLYKMDFFGKKLNKFVN